MLVDDGVYSKAPSSVRDSQETRVTHIPLPIEQKQFTPTYRKTEHHREIVQK
ncbi:MAG: hypothetical protein WB711_22420 [Terriglobales bacterium]